MRKRRVKAWAGLPMRAGALVHPYTDTLPRLPEDLASDADDAPIPEASGKSVPHLSATITACKQGWHVRWSLLRLAEGRPAVHLGKMHVSPTLWRTVFEPGLRQMQTMGKVRLDVREPMPLDAMRGAA
jgi:hypothetical protein